MINFKQLFRLAVATLIAAGLSACAGTKPIPYSGIASSSMMEANPQDDGGRVPYIYGKSSRVDWRRFQSMIIEPVTIYRGPDQQFGDLSEENKAVLANYMQTQFTVKLRNRFVLVHNPAPDTLRLRLTLTGADTNTPVIGTLSRFDIGGGIYNGVQTARGREGSFTGSASYAVEIYDALDNRLLSAFVTKQFPSPWNIGASMGKLAASRTGIDKGADALVEQLR